MDGPLVSIVTPSYNQGHFIRATIESVLSQDYPHLEYIIMDGGSTDETARVVRDYGSRLRFISEKDRGQSDAINKGFRLARGSIVSWLNSDDLYLPGAARVAVDAFQRNPQAGAVYGEGYQIDREGRISSRFSCTEPPNVWKLVHLSDYILQQTVYFRKDVLDRVGYLDEDLHYVMDWDILIRIAKRHPIEYVPEYMGCLREYPEAKSFAGGAKRIRELHAMLQRHTGMRLPPGSVVYGLDTYHQIWCDRVERMFPGIGKSVATKLQSAIRLAAGLVIGRTIHHSQGLYSDGWVGPRLHYMLPPTSGPLLIAGSLPDWDSLRWQTLSLTANGAHLGTRLIPCDDFQWKVELPPPLQGKLLDLEIRAARSTIPAGFRVRGDRRRLAYRLKSIRALEAPATVSPTVARTLLSPAQLTHGK